MDMNRRLFLEKMSDNKLKEIFDKIEDAQINGAQMMMKLFS